MQIVRVQEKDPFVPVAVEITEDLDVAFLSELVKNTYNNGDAWARQRKENEIGAGGVDVVTGSGDYEREYIPNGCTGWLVLGERWASFHPQTSVWNEYEKVD